LVGKALVLPTLMLILVSVFPMTGGKLKYIPIYKPLTIKANKKLPPHIAYMDTHFDNQDNEWSDFEKKSKQPLGVGLTEGIVQGPYVLTQKRALEGFVIRKSVEPVALGVAPHTFKTSAQAVQENEGPQWLKNIVREPASPLASAPKEEVVVHNLTAAKRVTGPIELTQGLAVTNEHHIEIRRSDEGVFREMGQVDLVKGSYSIDIDKASGAIVARLIDRSGLVLGEGSVRLSQLQIGQGRLIFGPRLEIAPSPTWTGRVSYYYPNNKKDTPPPHVTTFGGQNVVNVGKAGEISVDRVAKNSTTIMRAEAESYMPASKVMVASEKSFSIPMFPNSMMEALKTIVADQKRVRHGRLSDTSIVWGTVALDGKPLSGVTVSSETDPDSKAIYFNEFLIPDPKLNATSTSGLYAFVDMHEGFHALLAQRGDAYFGHQNVEVEVGSVAIGDIDNTLRTEPVHVRAFDAFSGEPVNLVANLQSLSEPVQVVDGSASIVLPQVSRMSMIYTEPMAEYVSANYFYNDQDSFIHMPMIKPDWLTELRVAAKVNEVPQTGTIVGFFNEERFEAYLAGQDKNSPAIIIYFDAAGRVASDHQSAEGGGFVIFNAPYGTQETVIVGASEKIFSKVVPVDIDTVSVLNFSSY